MPHSTRDHWLARPENIRLLWRIFAAILIALLIADFFVDHHSTFGFEGSFAFGAWYGFSSCVLLVVLSKGLGAVLKRPDTYYDG